MISEVLNDLIATTTTTPDFLIEQTKEHYQFLPQAQALFPSSSSYGVQAQKNYPPTAGFNWTGFLNDSQLLFPGELAQITLQGQDGDECALVHLSSKTVFLADLLMYSLVSNVPDGNFVPGTSNNQTSFFYALILLDLWCL